MGQVAKPSSWTDEQERCSQWFAKHYPDVTAHWAEIAKELYLQGSEGDDDEHPRLAFPREDNVQLFARNNIWRLARGAKCRGKAPLGTERKTNALDRTTFDVTYNPFDTFLRPHRLFHSTPTTDPPSSPLSTTMATTPPRRTKDDIEAIKKALKQFTLTTLTDAGVAKYKLKIGWNYTKDGQVIIVTRTSMNTRDNTAKYDVLAIRYHLPSNQINITTLEETTADLVMLTGKKEDAAVLLSTHIDMNGLQAPEGIASKACQVVFGQGFTSVKDDISSAFISEADANNLTRTHQVLFVLPELPPSQLPEEQQAYFAEEFNYLFNGKDAFTIKSNDPSFVHPVIKFDTVEKDINMKEKDATTGALVSVKTISPVGCWYGHHGCAHRWHAQAIGGRCERSQVFCFEWV